MLIEENAARTSTCLIRARIVSSMNDKQDFDTPIDFLMAVREAGRKGIYARARPSWDREFLN